MRNLWNFVANYPPRPSAQRRIPASIRSNLTWWNTLLPSFNGVLFFDDKARPILCLYTDASLLDLEGFFRMGQRLLGVKQQSNKQMLLQPEHKTFCWHLVMLLKRPTYYKRLFSLTSCRRLSFLTSCPRFFSLTSCPCLFSLTRCPLPLTVSIVTVRRQGSRTGSR